MDSLLFRSIEEKDFDIIKKLHEEFFPVRYNDQFYIDACKGIGINHLPLYSLVATTKNDDEVVGFILAQFLPTKYSDDNIIFSYNYPDDICYILTLGLSSKYRRYGIGSILVTKCIEYAITNKNCGAVYLHVITNNKVALKFYENNNFEYFKEIEDFYNINDRFYNAYLYVYYINGYQGPLIHRILKSARISIGKGIEMLYSFFVKENDKHTIKKITNNKNTKTKHNNNNNNNNNNNTKGNIEDIKNIEEALV